LETKNFGRKKRKISKNLYSENDFNLSLNEENNKLNAGNMITKPRGRRKIIKNEGNLKFTFEIPFAYNEMIKTNKNVVFFDYNNIVILKDIFKTNIDAYDRFIIQKLNLEQDVLDYFS